MHVRGMMAAAIAAAMLMTGIARGDECLEYRDYMRKIGSIYTWVTPYDIERRDGLVYATTWDGFAIFDTRDPKHMAVLSTLGEYWWTQTVDLVGNTAVVMTRDAGLKMLDVADPYAPRVVWTLPTLHDYNSSVLENGIIYYHSSRSLCAFDPAARRVIGQRTVVQGGWNNIGALAGRLLVSSDALLTVHDTSNPGELREMSQYLAPDYIRGIWAQGDTAFLSCGNGGIVQLNVAADGGIREVARFNLGSEVKRVEARLPWLYVLDVSGLKAVNVADPENPVVCGAVSTDAVNYQLCLSGNTAFVTNVPGIMAVDVTNPYDAPLIGRLPNLAARDVAVRGDYAYFACGTSGAWIAFIADPQSPVVVARIDALQGWSSSVTAVEVRGDFLYVGDDFGDSFSVLDLADPVRPRRLGTLNFPGYLGDLVVQDSVAFVACSPFGLHVVDVSVPGSPRLALTSLAGQSIKDLELTRGHIIATTVGGSTWLVDVTHPEVPGAPLELPALRNAEFVHVKGDRGFAVFLGHVDIFDLSDLRNPQLLSQINRHYSSFEGVADIAPDRNTCYISEGWALRIVDLADSRQPETIQFLRTPGYAHKVSMVGGQVYVMSDHAGVQIAAPQCEAPVVVAVDVKPGSSENRVNCDAANGMVPVAILGGGTLPIAEIDHLTVRFGRGEAREAHENRFGPIRHEEDVNGDGHRDLVFHFRLADAGIQCGDTKVTLTGETYDGQSLIGADRIQTTHPGDKEPGPGAGFTITPNPFNPRTTITFFIDRPGRVRVSVYDLRGRMVAELADADFVAGGHAVEWVGRDGAGAGVPSGAYLVRTEIEGRAETRKAILLR